MKALLVSYGFPPIAGVSVLRAAAFARHLPDEDITVEVLTVEDPPSGVVGAFELDGFVRDDTAVYRTWSDEPMRMVAGLRRIASSVTSKLKSSDESEPDDTAERVDNRSRLPRTWIERIQASYIPDEKIGWLPHAVERGIAVVTERGMDVIVSTGPPHTTHLIAQRISEETGVPYIVDLRDPWADNGLLAQRNGTREQENRALEMACLEGAAAIVVVTPGLAELYRERYPHLADRIHVIFNGYWAPEVGRALALAERDHSRIRMTYAGGFQGDGHGPETFLVGLAAGIEHGIVDRSLLEVRFVGPDERRFGRAIEALGLEDVVSCLPAVDHADALVEIASADLLLYIQGSASQFSLVLGGKFAEYLASGRPILALAKPGGDADRILSGLNRARVVDCEDAAHVAVALHDILTAPDAFEATRPKPESPSLAWTSPMKTYADLIRSSAERA